MVPWDAKNQAAVHRWYGRVFGAGEVAPLASTAYPQLKATSTNLATGEGIRVNIAGPAHIIEGADGGFTLVGTGNWGWGSHPDTGEPGLFLTSGRFVLSVDAAGNESFRRVGRLRDLCAELAI
jgi:hypothetical protein